MSESWVQWVAAACGAWVAWELRQLRHDVAHRIHYADCERRMAAQERRISKLEEQK